jgi:integrase/recombinase XerD
MSALGLQLERYLRLRRQLGYKLRGQSSALRNFVRFADEHGQPFITTKLALGWLNQPHLQAVTRGSRLAIVRRFAVYLSAIDKRTEIPPKNALPYKICRRPPYLYRDEEVQRLISTVAQIAPDDELKGVTHSILLGLLAISGMRVSEALALDREDVDLNRKLLIVRHGKGSRSRLVPLHSSTAQALQRYSDLRDRVYPRPQTSAFFLCERGTRLLYGTALRWFSMVACQLGLRKAGDRRGPRIHDLRHYFAIRTMLNWYRSNIDVDAHLPELSTFLGHARVSDTYWYLSATPELLMLATRRLERAQKGER